MIVGIRVDLESRPREPASASVSNSVPNVMSVWFSETFRTPARSGDTGLAPLGPEVHQRDALLAGYLRKLGRGQVLRRLSHTPRFDRPGRGCPGNPDNMLLVPTQPFLVRNTGRACALPRGHFTVHPHLPPKQAHYEFAQPVFLFDRRLRLLQRVRGVLYTGGSRPGLSSCRGSSPTWPLTGAHPRRVRRGGAVGRRRLSRAAGPAAIAALLRDSRWYWRLRSAACSGCAGRFAAQAAGIPAGRPGIATGCRAVRRRVPGPWPRIDTAHVLRPLQTVRRAGVLSAIEPHGLITVGPGYSVAFAL